ELSPVASVAKPIAMAFVPLAKAAFATTLLPPIAIELAPVPAALKPTDTLLVPASPGPPPKAVPALVPIEVWPVTAAPGPALKPNAVELGPDANALKPTAVELAPAAFASQLALLRRSVLATLPELHPAKPDVGANTPIAMTTAQVNTEILLR